MPRAPTAIEFNLLVEILFQLDMIVPDDWENIEEIKRFLEDNLSYGTDYNEEHFLEYCKYNRQYEDKEYP